MFIYFWCTPFVEKTSLWAIAKWLFWLRIIAVIPTLRPHTLRPHTLRPHTLRP